MKIFQSLISMKTSIYLIDRNPEVTKTISKALETEERHDTK